MSSGLRTSTFIICLHLLTRWGAMCRGGHHPERVDRGTPVRAGEGRGPEDPAKTRATRHRHEAAPPPRQSYVLGICCVFSVCVLCVNEGSSRVCAVYGARELRTALNLATRLIIHKLYIFIIILFLKHTVYRVCFDWLCWAFPPPCHADVVACGLPFHGRLMHDC